MGYVYHTYAYVFAVQLVKSREWHLQQQLLLPLSNRECILL